MRQIRAIEIDGDRVLGCDRLWPVTSRDIEVSHISSAVWSPDFETNMAVGMVRMTHWDEATDVDVITPDEVRAACVHEMFWA